MKKLIFSASIVSALLLGACAGEETKTKETDVTETKTTTDNSASDDVQEENKDVYFKDGEVKLNDLKIKITETKVIPVGQPGNEYGEKPVFAIWYDTTNLSDKDIDPTTAWAVVFTAIQDNDPNSINELEVGVLPDESHLDTQLETIKKDGTVSNSIAYELDDLETPVTLVATQGVMGDELGRQEYTIK